jgi:uncharacterized repeat protein (TIGR01451 family)
MRRQTKLTASLIASLAALLALAAPALALTQHPQWTVSAVSVPTNFAPGDSSGEAAYRVTVTNTGGAASDGSPISIADQLPAGLSLDAAGASGEDQLSQQPLSCAALTCTYGGVVVPGDSLVLRFPVDVEAGAPASVTNLVSAAGGGAPEATMSTPTAISPAAAGFGIAPGGAVTALSSTQAGAHADLTAAIAFNTLSAGGATAGDPKDASFDLPPGFAGDLPDTPSCPLALFSQQQCPVATQVGITSLAVNLGASQAVVAPLYKLAPDAGQAARIGFHAVAFNVQGDVSLRPGGSGLRTVFRNIAGSAAQLDSVVFSVWGVPADRVHDPLRWDPASAEFGAASEATRAPFLTNPTACSGAPLRATIAVGSWQQPAPGPPTEMAFGPLSGCERLAIEPALSAQPTTGAATSATGLDIDLTVPQTYDNADGLATPHLQRVELALPAGISLNPSAGAGLSACTPAQYAGEALDPGAGGGCPAESRLGAVRIESPALAEAASGSLFLATPHENPFGSLLALYLVARIPDRGVLVEAAGRVTPDPATGQLTTSFADLPQLPFGELSLRFRQGATSPLITPPACGEFSVRAGLTPYSDPAAVAAAASFQIVRGPGGGACPAAGPAPFHPRVSAGTLSNQAGAYSTLYQELSRSDGEAEINRFTTRFPPGLTGRLAGIPFCPDAAIAAARGRSGAAEDADPSCPPASQVGRVLVSAGVGSTLTWVPGRVYLAGPFDGARFSIVTIAATRVGPFDLGTVAVRVAIRIDPEAGRATADSSGSAPLPHIIDGIPLHVRDIRVYVDRPQFMLNPTSCDPFAVDSSLTGAGADLLSATDEGRAGASGPFQVAGCSRLPFRPKLSFKLDGAAKRGAHPSFSVTGAARPGEANFSRAETLLPRSEFLDQAHIRTVCTRVQFAAGSCPAGSIYGHATATTPLLDGPLEGPVYMRSSSHLLPDVVLVFHHRQIEIVLHGRVDSVNGRLRTTFEALPDAPVSSFTVTLRGGDRGLLVNSVDLCAGVHRTTVRLTGQNGKTAVSSRPLPASGCAKRKAAAGR